MTSEFAIAVHALVFLNHKGETISSEALAENVCTNPARIRKVLSKLKKRGLVETKEGLNGGYHVVKSPDQINLGEICEALEMDVVTVSWSSGSMDKACQIASGMSGIMDGIYDELNDICKRHLESITILDIDKRIFRKKEGA